MISNIAAYQFATLTELKPLRSRLLGHCREWQLKGTILLSTEGINLFVAGTPDGVDRLLELLRAIPGLAGLTPKFSESTHQPFTRMLVRIKKEIIGKSTHGFEQAIAAEQEGADYIGFGPLFATPTKPGRPAIGLDEIRRVHEQVKIPIFCIGGIKLENLSSVLAAGAQRVVIVSGLLKAADIVSYCREVKSLIPNS